MKKMNWPLMALLIVITFAWFYPSVNVGFLADDYDFLEHVDRAESTGHPITTLARTSIGGTSFFRPITNISFWVDKTLSHNNPIYFHLTNIFLFALIAVAIFTLAKKLFTHRFAPMIAAIITILNPFSVETVTWVAGRTDLLSLNGLLWGLVALFSYRQKATTKKLFLFILFSAFAIGSKENGVLMAPLLVLTDLLFFRAEWRENKKTFLAPYGALFLVFAFYFLLRFQVIGQIVAESGSSGNYAFVPRPGDFKKFWETIWHFLISKEFLSCHGITRENFINIYRIGAGIITLVAVFVFVRRKNYRAKLVFLVACSATLILPVAAFMRFITPSHQNIRFLFAPSLVLGLLIALLYEAEQKKSHRAVLTVGALAMIFPFSISSRNDQHSYQYAGETWTKVRSAFATQVVPEFANDTKTHLLLSSLPGVRKGAFVTPAKISFALKMHFPEMQNADIQMYGVRPLNNSPICQMMSGEVQSEKIAVYHWEKDTRFASDDFLRETQAAEFLSMNTLLQTTEKQEINFPFTSNKKSEVWDYAGGSIDPWKYRYLFIPVQSENLRGQKSTFDLTQKLRLDFRFYSGADISKIDPGLSLRGDVKFLDDTHGIMVFHLCEYPFFYAMNNIQSLQFRFTNTGGVTFGAPEFR